MPIATIIGAVVAAGAAVFGAVIDSNDVDEANRIGLQLAEQTREDKLKLEEEERKLNRFGIVMRGREFDKSMKQRQEEFDFTKKEKKLDRKERERDRQYAKREKFKADSLDFVNKNAQTRSLFMNSVRRGA